LRIALFSDTFYPQVNGVALTLQRLVQHLELRNIPHMVVVPSYSDGKFSGNIHYCCSIPFFLYPECKVALPNFLMINNTLRRFQPDIIHLATPFTIGLCGIHYARSHEIPHVASYHTHFDRFLEYYQLQFANRWIWEYFRWFHQTCTATFVPSRETKEKLTAQGITRLDIWKRGVDCSLFHPYKRSQQLREKHNIREQYLFLYVGRMAAEKDLDILLEIMHKLPTELSNNVHWLLVGDGPLLSDVRSQAPNNVTFTGYLRGEELAEAYATADLFVFPSSSETFGNVILEAYASGLPVIGAQAGGTQELIQHGMTGMLCPTRDVESFVKTIIHLIENPEHLQSMGYYARRYALTQSWESIFDHLLLQYEHAISLERARRKNVGSIT